LLERIEHVNTPTVEVAVLVDFPGFSERYARAKEHHRSQAMADF
jgi:hypothetical protein